MGREQNPAFPCVDRIAVEKERDYTVEVRERKFCEHCGINIREFYAACALIGILSADKNISASNAVTEALQVADTFIARESV